VNRKNLLSLRIIIALGLWFAASLVCAQEKPAGEKITENGRHFILYKVQPGETLYSIGKRYHVDLQELTAENPGLEKGLKSGSTIRIPVEGKTERKIGQETDQKPGRLIQHKVQKKETLYSISRKYGITIEELTAANPGKTKLKKGDVLRIPHTTAPQNEKSAGTPVKETAKGAVILHTVREGETLYALSRKYEVSVEDIVKANPILETRLPHAGDTLRITGSTQRADQPEPDRKNSETVVKTGDCDLLPASVREKKRIKVALMIPLMLTENKLLNHDLWGSSGDYDGSGQSITSDTLRNNIKLASQMQFQGNSENFLHFYEGALLAVDSLEKTGIKVDLEVWDTEQKSSKVKNFVSSGVLSNADLIIGPVYPAEQKEISDFAAKHKIPVISPLSPSDEYTKDNPYFFQINPSREYTAAKTREYIANSYKNGNIVVLQTSNSGNEAENEASALRKAIEKEGGKGNGSIRICNFRKDGFASLKNMMVKDKKNVLVMPTVNEAEVSVVVSNIKNLNNEFDLVVIGNNRFPQFESIDPEHYHNANLEFLTPYWPDMEQEVTRSFIHNFRVFYRTDPNQYSIQGYDVTFFFVKAISDYGADFGKCLTREKISLVQGTYRFHQPEAGGGYVNRGLSVVQYLPSFEIDRKMVIAD